MVKCWNCKHLARAYSGTPEEGKLFRKEYRKCKINGTVFERHSDITEERECDSFEQSERWAKKNRNLQPSIGFIECDYRSSPRFSYT